MLNLSRVAEYFNTVSLAATAAAVTVAAVSAESAEAFSISVAAEVTLVNDFLLSALKVDHITGFRLVSNC